MRPVGILGGMGPQATILMMNKILQAVPAQDDQDHVPVIVDQNPQIPSRIAHLFAGEGPNPGPILADMAQRLAAYGAQALAMPCNTAHYYAPQIRNAVSIPFLDMVSLSAAHAARLRPQGGVVGILASPAVRKLAVFEAALAPLGLRAIYAEDELAMLAAIRQIKAQGDQPEARQTLQTAAQALSQREAHVQMIACTEFSLIADALPPVVTGFDSLDCLVAEVVKFSQSK